MISDGKIATTADKVMWLHGKFCVLTGLLFAVMNKSN